jgi:hypothetical protein
MMKLDRKERWLIFGGGLFLLLILGHVGMLFLTVNR